jgi:hypothetical protein
MDSGNAEVPDFGGVRKPWPGSGQVFGSPYGQRTGGADDGQSTDGRYSRAKCRGSGDTLRVVSMKAELKGHEFDLDALVDLFPSGPIRVVREDGVHYLLADEIDSRQQGLQYYEVAPKVLERVNGLARVANPVYQPVELSGCYLEGKQRNVVVKPDSVVMRVRVGTPRIVVTGSDGVVHASLPPLSPQRAVVVTTHPDVAEALALMGQPVALGWIELYKVFEIVGDSVKPNTLDKIGLATAHDLSAFRASANRPDVGGADARHARMSGGPPKHHMSLPEGRQFISDLVRAWIDSLR